MPSHVWGGPEMKTPDGFPIYYKDPNEPKPCPPRPRPRGPYDWFRNNRGVGLTLLNLVFLLAVFFLINNLTSSGVVEIGEGWTLKAQYFPDDESGVLSLVFESQNPRTVNFTVTVGQNERSLQTFDVELSGPSPRIVRRRLLFKPQEGPLDLWIFGKKLRVSRG